MSLRRIAPTLLLLASMPMAVAAEGVAPVIGASASTFVLTDSASAQVIPTNDPPPIQIDLGSSIFVNNLFYFSTTGPDVFTPFGMATNRGIAVVGTEGTGSWHFKIGSSEWTQLNFFSDEYGAQLLALSPGVSQGSVLLGYKPAPDEIIGNGNETNARLTFRAVDDITAADSASNYYNFDPNDRIGVPYDWNLGILAGSPSPYSAETRTLSVIVTAENDAPVWQSSSFEVPVSTAHRPYYGGRPVEISVSNIVSSTANARDPDGTNQSALGIMLEIGNQTDYVWERVTPTGATVIPPLGGDGYLFNHADIIRIKPNNTIFNLGLQPAIGTVSIWDGTQGTAGGPFSATRGGNSSVSDLNGAINLTLTLNQAPIFEEAISETVVFNPGQNASVQVSVSDSDGQIADFGGYIGEGGIDSTSVTVNPVDPNSVIGASWTVVRSNLNSATGTVSFTGLPNATGNVGNFGIAAEDDLGQLTSLNFTLYGNSAPVWPAEAFSVVQGLTVAEDGQLPGIELPVSDPDIDTPFLGFFEYLTLNGEDSSSIAVPTSRGGIANITLFTQNNYEASVPNGAQAITGIPVNGGNGYSVFVEYTPPVNFNGDDSVDVPIQDSMGLSPATPLTLNITVTSVNDDPIISDMDVETGISNQSISVPQGASGGVQFNATDADVGDVLTWTQVGQSDLGTVAITGNPGAAPTITFTAGQTLGTGTLEFRVTDVAGAFRTVLLPVTVTEIEVAPVITTPAPLVVTLAPGGSTTLTVTASDPNAGEVLQWNVVGGSELASIMPPQSPGFSATFAITAGQLAGTSSVLLRVEDSTEQTDDILVTINVVVPGNQPPTITAPENGTTLGTVLGGTSRALVARASDPDAGDILSWSVTSLPTKGSVAPLSGTGSSVPFLYTADLLASGADSFELQVADGRGGSARMMVTASVTPNTPPDVSTPIGVSETQNGTVIAVAVRGQSFRTLIGGDDQETPRTVAVTVSGALPTGIVFSSEGNAGLLTGTPTVSGSFNFSIALDDGVNRTITPVQLTVVEPVTASVASPTIPVSTPDRTAYGSFLPGSAENFSALVTALEGRLPSQSRAFWWNATTQTYAELPTLPAAGTEAWHAVWLASTAPITLPSTITAVAMPYAVDLAPGWTFFGVPPVTDGTTVITTHAWATFQIQSNAGVPLTSTQRASALGNADAGGPFAWDGETYARTTNLVTGAGYWLKNTSGAPLRLVRTATATMTVLGVRAAPVRADEQPPAPPGGKAAQATDASGGCGVGSGIGLFGLSMAFLFTRLRRRG